MTNINHSATGEQIYYTTDNIIQVPDYPIIPSIAGDGIGAEVTSAMKQVVDAAVVGAWGTRRKIIWCEIPAGSDGLAKTGSVLPESTIESIRAHKVAIKGPLMTPVGGGFRSLNVHLRKVLDLFACVRPVRWIPGIPSPVKHPENVNMTIYRENTEDVYAGIEWESGSEEAERLISILEKEFDVNIRHKSGLGIKPMSPFASKRLIAASIDFAIANNRDSVTLVHKGNIMKYTEGAFKKWGYELAASDYSDVTIPENECQADGCPGKIIIKDRIADAMFQDVLLHPAKYSVIALPNLNGDYLSDALAAQVGGLGLAPGANIGKNTAVFEATHGTAPALAGKDIANPGSLILSAVMLLRHINWHEPATAIEQALERTIANRIVTPDLAEPMGCRAVGCAAFAEAIVKQL